MKNVVAKQVDNKLIIEIDLTQDHGPSSTGKSNIVGSTNGYVRCTGPHANVSFNLNVVKAKR